MKFKRGDRVKINYEEGNKDDHYVGYGLVLHIYEYEKMAFDDPGVNYYQCALDDGTLGDFPERCLTLMYNCLYFNDIQRGFDRYEKVRRLSARSFADLCHRNLTEGIPFDDLVDQIGEQK